MTQNAGDYAFPHANDYAFPHANTAEGRRLDLFAERLDPLTKRRIGQLGLGPAVRCLEIGGGRGSIARWLCQDVAPQGYVTATDLETGFLSRLGLADISADAELDIVLPGTALAEFYRLSVEALSQSLISAGLLTAAEVARLTARLAQPDFTGCGFAHIGAWGRRNDHPAG